MEEWPWDEENKDVCVGDYTSYIGGQDDHDVDFRPELAALDNGVWENYQRTLLDEDLKRELTLDLPGGPLKVLVDPEEMFVHLLDQLPVIDTYHIEGPPDEGMGSAAMYAYFIAGGVSREELAVVVQALAEAIRKDHEVVINGKTVA